MVHAARTTPHAAQQRNKAERSNATRRPPPATPEKRGRGERGERAYRADREERGDGEASEARDAKGEGARDAV